MDSTLFNDKIMETIKGQKIWDTRQISNGNYLYYIQSDDEILKSGKVTISK